MADPAGMAIVPVGALRTHSRPATTVRDACAKDQSLVFLRTPFAATLARSIAVHLIGLPITSDRRSELPGTAR